MPDRPEGDHRRNRRFLALFAVLALAGSATAAPAAPAASRPTVTGFSFSPVTFAASTRAQRMTTIRFTLSKRATVKIDMARKLRGRRSGGRCVKGTRKLAKRRACTRYLGRGRLVRSKQQRGQRTVAFSGRIAGKSLAAGTYRATIVAVDAAGRRSAPKTASFRISGRQSANNTTPPPSPAPVAGAQRRLIRPCTVTLPSVAAVAASVASAVPGTVVCLAPGSYGKLSLNASPPGEVVVQPAGSATIAGASMAGSNLTLEGFNVAGDEVTVQPGSNHMTVQFNRISGGYFGVQAGPTTTTTVNDVTIRGNKFVGNFGEDAIRLNRYHDADGDGIGALIEGNEITGVVEDGAHNDCLQTVWVGDHLIYRRNWLHGNNCQGFFVKDQASPIDTIVVEDNLIVDHNLPCQPDSLCPTWVLSPVQVFGPLTSLRMANNTVWTPFRNGGVYVRGDNWGSFQFVNNVTYRLEAPDGNAPFANYSSSNNVTCNRGAWPATGVTTQCSLPFPNVAADDYRLGGGRGVDWAPADQQYGP
ncbi:MAG TPA: right-handed parallel beta-helix repeat-containing protein [Solirubrobacteraceae bacterium]